MKWVLKIEKSTIGSQNNFGISCFLVCYNKYVIIYDTSFSMRML